MYYQHAASLHHLRPYQQLADDGRMLQPQQPLSFCDSVMLRTPSAFTSNRDFSVFHRPADDSARQHRVWNNGHGGTSAPESRVTSSYPDDVIPQTCGVPAVMSAPSPYDCKPPYSYISLIAMAIESSPRRRSVYISITELIEASVSQTDAASLCVAAHVRCL